MSPRWESEIRTALPNCADIPQGLAFDLNDCKNTTMHRYHWLVVAPEITQPQAVWMPSENKCAIQFQYEAEKGLRFWVEFEINEIEFCDCAEQVNILEPGDNLEQVLEGGITTAGAQHLIIFYAMKYGIAEQVAAARLDHESEQAQLEARRNRNYQTSAIVVHEI